VEVTFKRINREIFTHPPSLPPLPPSLPATPAPAAALRVHDWASAAYYK
jgi:hypothetical protein